MTRRPHRATSPPVRARPFRPAVSESRIKRITQIARITPPPYRRFIVPIHCVLRRTYPPGPLSYKEGERMAFWRFVSLAVLMALREWITP